MQYVYNSVRIILGIMFLAGGIAYLELSLFGSSSSPGWKPFLIAIAIAGVIAACCWDEKHGRSNLIDRLRSMGQQPRTEQRSDGTVVQVYHDGTQIVWKNGELVEFICADAPIIADTDF